MVKAPSELHACLTNERIDRIGNLIARTRQENLAFADDRDNGWSLGCRAYIWCCKEIQQLAGNADWLRIIDPSLKFIFAIENINISMYKGTPSKPKKNIQSRAQSYPELRQISLLNNIAIPSRLCWAYAVETDSDGELTNIEFIGVSESGDVIASRRVPINSIPQNVVGIRSKDDAPVDLPAAKVSLAASGKKLMVEGDD